MGWAEAPPRLEDREAAQLRADRAAVVPPRAERRALAKQVRRHPVVRQVSWMVEGGSEPAEAREARRPAAVVRGRVAREQLARTLAPTGAVRARLARMPARRQTRRRAAKAARMAPQARAAPATAAPDGRQRGYTPSATSSMTARRPFAFSGWTNRAPNTSAATATAYSTRPTIRDPTPRRRSRRCSAGASTRCASRSTKTAGSGSTGSRQPTRARTTKARLRPM